MGALQDFIARGALQDVLVMMPQDGARKDGVVQLAVPHIGIVNPKILN